MHIEDLIEPKRSRGKSLDGIWWLYLIAAPFFLLISYFGKSTNIPLSFKLIGEGEWASADGTITPLKNISASGYTSIDAVAASDIFYWTLLEEFLFIAAFGIILYAMKKISNSVINNQIFHTANVNRLRIIAIVFLYLFILHPHLDGFISDMTLEHLSYPNIRIKKHVTSRNYSYFVTSLFFFTLAKIFKEGIALREDTDLTI